eukprot:m.25444 g.25444  ORF g.25444 m.25444 type:complete len:89 (+) comp11600_c0_seq1:637-903(+)
MITTASFDLVLDVKKVASGNLCFVSQFYPIGSAVLALYPQTTCFYPAEVSQLPTEAKPTYTLHFDDDDYEDGRVRFQEVAVKYVIPAQ